MVLFTLHEGQPQISPTENFTCQWCSGPLSRQLMCPYKCLLPQKWCPSSVKYLAGCRWGKYIHSGSPWESYTGPQLTLLSTVPITLLQLILPTVHRIQLSDYRLPLVTPKRPSRPLFPLLISDGMPWQIPSQINTVLGKRKYTLPNKNHC